MKQNLNKLILLICLCVIPLVFSCKKDEIKSNIGVFDISMESDWSYFLIHESGGYILVDEINNVPQTIYISPAGASEGFPIYFDENGIPYKMIVNNMIFLFGNFEGNKLDMSVVNENGKIEIYREVLTDFKWDEITLKSTSRWTKQKLFKTISYAASGLACAATIASGAVPLAVLSCGSLILEAVEDLGLLNDVEIMGIDVSEGARFTSAVFSCTGLHLLPCASKLTAYAFEDLAEAESQFENRAQPVHLAQAIVTSGNGDVKVTLSWNTHADLDLHVIDPNGEQIYWNHDISQSGGFLDVDDWGEETGGHEENIFWKDGTAPLGTYQIYVHYFDWEETWRPNYSSYKIYVKAFENEYFFDGSIDIDEWVYITDFDQNGLKSGKLLIFELTKDGIKERKN